MFVSFFVYYYFFFTLVSFKGTGCPGLPRTVSGVPVVSGEDAFLMASRIVS